jgi:hypothetical protein
LTADQQTLLRSAHPPMLVNGLYAVATTDCDEPYVGEHAGRSVYVVGMGTDREQFFTRAQRSAAVALARSERLTIDHLPASQLCPQVVETLFAS